MFNKRLYDDILEDACKMDKHKNNNMQLGLIWLFLASSDIFTLAQLYDLFLLHKAWLAP